MLRPLTAADVSRLPGDGLARTATVPWKGLTSAGPNGTVIVAPVTVQYAVGSRDPYKEYFIGRSDDGVDYACSDQRNSVSNVPGKFVFSRQLPIW